MIAIKTLKLPFTLKRTADQHDATGTLGIPLQERGVDTTLCKQAEKASPMASCPKRPAKATGVPKRANPQATFAGAPPRRSSTGRSTAGSPPSGPKPIDQSFTETDDNGTKRHPTASEPSLRVGRAFQAAKQRLNDPSIGGRKGVIPQVIWAHPTHLLTGKGLRFPRDPVAEMHHKAQLLVAVGVINGDQPVAPRSMRA